MIQTKAKPANPVTEKFGNLKVLLAECIDVNQLPAKSILQCWGAEIKIAVTGFEVLALMEKEDFDVILIDIQMPEKSGLEATGEIRKLSNLKKQNIPIIALTATALKGEEKKYMNAGIDDFLTKPFKERDLYEVIERVLHARGSLKVIKKEALQYLQKQPYEQVLISEKLYDLKQVEEIASGNKEFIISLVNIFLDTIPVNSREMVQAAQLKQWDKVSKLAHKLKSTIDTLNISSIKTDIRTIELDAINEINLDNITRLITKVDKLIHLIAEQLTREFSS